MLQRCKTYTACFSAIQFNTSVKFSFGSAYLYTIKKKIELFPFTQRLLKLVHFSILRIVIIRYKAKFTHLLYHQDFNIT